MINVLIHGKDNFFKRGLAGALNQTFEKRYQRKLSLFEGMEEQTIVQMDVIILDVFPGDNVVCHPELHSRKKRSLVVGFYEGEAPLLHQREPMCLKNMVYLNKRSPITTISNSIVVAWNEQLTGGGEWVTPDCTSCSRTKLSKQQEKIALFTVKGFNNRQISGFMNINAKTVSAHKHCIMEKFNIDNNADLVKFLRRRIAMKWPENMDLLA